MKLIVGLGNPGDKYEHTWHNLGFLAVNQLQKKGFGPWKNSAKHKLIGAQGNIEGQKIILVKPMTYMNNSGQAVTAIATYYKIAPEDIIVIHDELDLLQKNIRISQDSAAAGHNGIKSIISHLNSKKIIRLRIGIKSDKPHSIPADKYVLKKIGIRDKLWINRLIKDQVIPAVTSLIQDGLEKTQNKFN